MFEDIETHKKLSKWIIGTFTACILIYLGSRLASSAVISPGRKDCRT